MSSTTQKTTPGYLRAVRLQAGYANRGTAATAVPFSPEVIGRHERGEVEVDPHAAVAYAENYKRKDILYQYCNDCPVGRATGRQATARDLTSATFRMNHLLRTAAGQIAVALEEIAFDGVIDDHERPVFDQNLERLKALGETISDFFLLAEMPENKNGAAPVAPGNDSLLR